MKQLFKCKKMGNLKTKVTNVITHRHTHFDATHQSFSTRMEEVKDELLRVTGHKNGTIFKAEGETNTFYVVLWSDL